MKDYLKDKPVLAMYDVRGIQDYIFRSNRLQDVIGASIIVENIIIDGLNTIIRTNNWNQEEFLTEWESDGGTEYLENQNVKMQVLFIGGGNAYVLFRSGELCSEVNKQLSMYVLKNTYSLHLAIAVVEKTDSYKLDYKNIQEEMRLIKARMSETRPLGIQPFMKADSDMGYPLTPHKNKDNQNICTESWLKQKAYNERSEEGRQGKTADKILDNMVTWKGDNSTLAIVHIDGNNMGKRLMGIMSDKEAYPEAIETMRTISKNIAASFTAAYKTCENYIEGDPNTGEKGLADRIKPDRKGKLIRKIILAGDDITFICNAKAALYAVFAYIQEASKHYLYKEDNDKAEDTLRKYGLSACAGIAYFNSHFPFRDAYDVAEACCSSAKKRAKTPICRAGGEAEGSLGSFVDYQVCMNVNAGKLEEYRNAQYQVAGNTLSLLYRPYYVSCDVLDSINDLNDRNSKYNLSILLDNMNYFTDEKNLPNSQVKKLRNAFSISAGEVEKYRQFLESRGRVLPDEDKYPENSWYDALEIMEYAVEKGAQLDDTDDKVTE